MRTSIATTLLAGTAFALIACGGEGAPPCPEISGTTCTWAGVPGLHGFKTMDQDDGDGHPLLQSLLNFPEDLTFDAAGRAYVNDWNNHRVRRAEPDGTFQTVIGTDYEGDGPPEMEDRYPEGNPAGALGTTVALNHPTDIEFLPDGRLLLAAWHNNKLRIYDPETQLVTVLAGNDYGYRGDDGPAWAASFNQPKAVVLDTDGTVYTIDQRNVRIRKLTTNLLDPIRTMAGTGVWGNVGDGGQALDAQFGFDIGITPQPTGALVLHGRELLVADSENHRIRRINLDTGIIDCIAGQSGVAGYSGDGGPALTAQFNLPVDIELGPDGRLYVADRLNSVIRAIDLDTGIIERVAGNLVPCAPDGTCTEPEDGVPPLEMQLNQPYGIAFDPDGNLFIADTHNQRILKVAR